MTYTPAPENNELIINLPGDIRAVNTKVDNLNTEINVIVSNHTTNVDNPHNTTAEQVGAAPAQHVHSVNNITDLNDVLGSVGSKPVVKTAVIGTSWIGTIAPYTQIISIAEIAGDCPVLISLQAGASEEVRNQYKDLDLGSYSQADGSVTIAAWGDKNVVDIPISVVVWNDYEDGN